MQETSLDIAIAFEEIINILDEHYSWTKPHKYIITEWFPYSDKDIKEKRKDIFDYIPNIFDLYNLRMTVEDEVVWSGDCEDKLLDITNTIPLLSFPLKSVKDVYLHDKQINIIFDKGVLKIEY